MLPRFQTLLRLLLLSGNVFVSGSEVYKARIAWKRIGIVHDNLLDDWCLLCLRLYGYILGIPRLLPLSGNVFVSRSEGYKACIAWKRIGIVHDNILDDW